MKIHNESSLPTIDYRTLKPLQGNLKDLTKANHDKLLRVLNKRGFTTPVFVWQDGDEMYLMDGHQRSRVMIANDLNDNGSYEVPYVLIPAKDLKEAKEQLLEITSQYGHMTVEGLDEFAFDLDMAELDVNFDAIDMDKFLDNLVDEDEADDEAPEVDEVNPPVSVLGQVYQLGAHRLMCGSATDFGAVSELMNGVEAQLVHTDPPYGVSMSRSLVSGKDNSIQNDDLDSEGLRELLVGAFANALAVAPNSSMYWWIGFRAYSLMESVFLQNGVKPTNCIVWMKPSIGLGVTGYRYRHELCVFAGKIADKSLSDVWEFGRDNEGLHPTMKPISLVTHAIKNSSRKNDVVLDLFGGSGSTLIAAEKLGRTCYMMELDPKYCDVIRKRYAKHIGSEDWEAVTPAVEYATA